jgi:DNA invertase Pin-like site-specific DNA recombinase
MKKIGYARVSTKEQVLDLQLDALKKAGCEKIFRENESGAKTDRPELEKCLEYLRPGDVLVVYKIDRLARTTKQLINLIDDLQKKGVHFQAIGNSIDTTTPQGRFFFTIMAGLSEMERELIIERTRAGLSSARARGRLGGRPRVDDKKIKRAIKLYRSGEMTAKEIAEAVGISRAKLYQALNE